MTSDRFEWKDYKLLIVGMVLCLYFAYHLCQGPRSFFHLQDLRQENAILSQTLSHQQEDLTALETKVSKLRPETLDPDFLDERARVMLGYMEADEMMVVE